MSFHLKKNPGSECVLQCCAVCSTLHWPPDVTNHIVSSYVCYK